MRLEAEELREWPGEKFSSGGQHFVLVKGAWGSSVERTKNRTFRG